MRERARTHTVYAGKACVPSCGGACNLSPSRHNKLCRWEKLVQASGEHMEQIDTLIVGAGISGLAAAAALNDNYLILEADTEIGGYCKTVKRDGFVWDYSGHFFHFKHPDVEAWLRARMPGQEIRTVARKSV